MATIPLERQLRIVLQPPRITAERVNGTPRMPSLPDDERELKVIDIL